MIMITVILIGPEIPGNIGAIARAMKNFNLNKLILINPKCNHLSLDALSRATHAKDILRKAKVTESSILGRFDHIIGTTAITGTDYNVPRVPLTPKEMANKIDSRQKVAILFGRESTGLRNKEIERCDFIVKIPASESYPTMNISHAASILFYELFNSKNTQPKATPASKKEKDVILQYIDDVLKKITSQTTYQKDTQRKVWKKVLGKSMITKREAFSLMGFFRKLR